MSSSPEPKTFLLVSLHCLSQHAIINVDAVAGELPTLTSGEQQEVFKAVQDSEADGFAKFEYSNGVVVVKTGERVCRNSNTITRKRYISVETGFRLIGVRETVVNDTQRVRIVGLYNEKTTHLRMTYNAELARLQDNKKNIQDHGYGKSGRPCNPKDAGGDNHPGGPPRRDTIHVPPVVIV